MTVSGGEMIVAMTRYTQGNIEDWDFRAYVSFPNRDPLTAGDWDDADDFLGLNLIQVILVDSVRLNSLKALLDRGWATLSEDRQDVVLEPFGADVLPHMTSWRDRFTSYGRLKRRVIKSLVREWKKNGRLRATILPKGEDWKKQFPGLS